MTNQSAAQFAPAVTPEQIARDIAGSSRLEIIFSGVPEFYSFEYLGQPLSKERKLSDRTVFELPADVPPQGVDIIARVQWRDSKTKQAAEARLIAPDGRVLASRTCWSENGIFEGRIPLP